MAWLTGREASISTAASAFSDSVVHRHGDLRSVNNFTGDGILGR